MADGVEGFVTKEFFYMIKVGSGSDELRSAGSAEGVWSDVDF